MGDRLRAWEKSVNTRASNRSTLRNGVDTPSLILSGGCSTCTECQSIKFTAGGSIRWYFPNRDVVHVVPITHRDLIVIVWSWLQQRLIGDGAAPVGKKRGAGKDEHQMTPSVWRYPDFHRRFAQLNSAFIVGGAVLPHTMDVNGCADS